MTLVTLLGVNKVNCVGGLGKELGLYLSGKVAIFIAELDSISDKEEKLKLFYSYYER